MGRIRSGGHEQIARKRARHRRSTKDYLYRGGLDPWSRKTPYGSVAMNLLAASVQRIGVEWRGNDEDIAILLEICQEASVGIEKYCLMKAKKRCSGPAYARRRGVGTSKARGQTIWVICGLRPPSVSMEPPSVPVSQPPSVETRPPSRPLEAQPPSWEMRPPSVETSGSGILGPKEDMKRSIMPPCEKQKRRLHEKNSPCPCIRQSMCAVVVRACVA